MFSFRELMGVVCVLHVVVGDSLVEDGQPTSYGSYGVGAVGCVGSQEVCDVACGCVGSGDCCCVPTDDPLAVVHAAECACTSVGGRPIDGASSSVRVSH